MRRGDVTIVTRVGDIKIVVIPCQPGHSLLLLASLVGPGEDEDHRLGGLPGDIVQVAYRGGANRDQVGILHAVIENITVRGGAPVYGLRCLDGQLLSPGDSGGGIWYGESFVGNNWSIVLTYVIEATSAATDTRDPTAMTQTDLSYAAIFPQIFP